MEQILSLLSKEIKDNIPMKYNNNKYIFLELSAYSEKTFEFYFLYRNKLKDYFLLTFSLLNQNLKSKIKLPPINHEINQLILHPINNDHLCLLGLNSITIIKSLSEFTKDNSTQNNKDIIYSLNFGQFQIVKFNFSYHDYYFGILLSNNTFVFDSISQHSYNNLNYLPLNESNIACFNFIPLHSCGWENFMILFMNRKGSLFLCGPIFPDQFTLDKEYILAMKENIAKKKQEYSSKITNDDLLNDFLFQNIQEGLKNSFKTTVLIRSSDYMKKNNTNLILMKLQLNSISQSDFEKMTYKEFFILEGLPITIIRISLNNTIDVMIITGELNPIRKESNKVINTVYHIEQIDLLEQALLSSKFKCIQINNKDIIMILMNNVYKIRIPYISQLKQLLVRNTFDYNMMFQFKSQVIQLLSHSPDYNTNKEIPLNYYFSSKIFGDLIIITYVKDQFIHESIDLISKKEENDNSMQLIKKNNSKLNIPNSDQLKQKEYKKQEVNYCLINSKNNNTKFWNENNNEAIENEFEKYANDYKDFVPLIKDNLYNQMAFEFSMLNKSKEVLNILQVKYNNYLNSLESINKLNKKIGNKKQKVNEKIVKIATLINKIAKQKGKANKTIINNRFIVIKDQANELASVIESIKGNQKNQEILSFPSIESYLNSNLYLVTQNNINNKNIFLNEIYNLKNKIIEIENDLQYFNKNK